MGLIVTWIRMVQTTCPRPTLLQHHLTYHSVRSSHSSSVQVMHILKTLSCTSSPSLSGHKHHHIAAVLLYQLLILAYGCYYSGQRPSFSTVGLESQSFQASDPPFVCFLMMRMMGIHLRLPNLTHPLTLPNIQHDEHAPKHRRL